MADKGFTIEDVLPLGVSLNIPPFLGMADQMSAEDVVKTQEIASLRFMWKCGEMWCVCVRCFVIFKIPS